MAMEKIRMLPGKCLPPTTGGPALRVAVVVVEVERSFKVIEASTHATATVKVLGTE
jgi:hypothetical protein